MERQDLEPTSADPGRDLIGRQAVPARIGPYQILDELGRGGIGVVYRARHDVLSQLEHGAQSLAGRWRYANDVGWREMTPLVSLGTEIPPEAQVRFARAGEGGIPQEALEGHWAGNGEHLYLRGSGGAYLGIYGKDEGRFAGSVEGAVLRGSWSEAPTRQAPEDAGEMELNFERKAAALCLHGRWKNGATGGWWGDWALDWCGIEVPEEIEARFARTQDFPR